MLRQGGDAALRSLDQAAATAAAPGDGASGPPGPAPEAEPLPDPVAAPPPEAAGPAADALGRRDDATAQAEGQAAAVGGVRAGVAQLASTSVQYAPAAVDPEAVDGAGPGDPAAAEQQRAEASAMVSGFLGTVATRSDEILSLGAAIPKRMKGAAAASVDAIAVTVEERSHAVSGHIAHLRAEAAGEARTARAVVGTRHAATTEAMRSATAAARERVESVYSGSLQAIDAKVTAQLRVIDDRYRQGDERFRGAGRTVGGEAAQRGSQMAADYMRGLRNVDDSFLDGPLTYKRGEARANAAREISKAYQSGLADESNKQADQAMQGKSRDVESVQTTARQAREALTGQHTAVLATLADAEAASLRQADQTRTRLNASIARALEGAEQALATQEVALIDNLRATARSQAATVEQRATELAGTMQEQVGQAAAGLLEAGAAVAARVQDQEAPPLDQLASGLSETSAQLDGTVAAMQTKLEQGQGTSEQQIAEAGAAVSAGLSSSSQAGLDGAAATASQANSTIVDLGGSAAEAFGAIQQSHAKTTTTTATTSTEGFKRAVDGVQHAYDEMSAGIQRGFEQNARALEDGLRGALPKMESEIRAKAEEAASHVPPRWKSIVKWVLIIAVIVVVALVIGPFVIGAVGAALGTGALMTGIIAGAIVGAATSAAIQVISNWAENRPIGEGVGRAALVGAIGGAVGGGFGVWVGQLGQQGVAVASTAFRQFALNTVANVITETGINLATGNLTWETFGMSLLTAVAVGGAMHGASMFKPVAGIQSASAGVGERFGGAIRTGLGGSVSINYRAASAPPGQIGEERPVREGDEGLSARGTRPGPGERTTTSEEWRAQSSRERAERSVAGVDQPLENPMPNAATEGHGHGRHGHQTTDAQQAERVRTGTPPDGGHAPAGRASKFRTPEAEAEALGRARRALQADLDSGAVPSFVDPITGDRTYVNPANGAPVRRPVLVTTNDPRGFGSSSQVAQRVGGPSSPYVLDSSGNRIPVTDPNPLPNARVVWEYVPSVNDWRPVTYFPEP